ncbi:MAG: ankyrin repeat domain-containing protein [Planctomycetota bacterium]|nr:ankyrin repeat domain-containing protein [Planctomycetota bacterium]
MHRSLYLNIMGTTAFLVGGFFVTVASAQPAPGTPPKQVPPPSPGQISPSSGPVNTPPSGPTAPGQLTQQEFNDPQVIVAEPEVIELGTFSTTETKEGTITLRNTGIEAVTIRSAKASCGCTTSDFQRNTVLGPGETTDVTIKMRGGPTARKLKKTVTFTIDGYPQLRVPVEGESISYVTMKPDKLGIDANPDGKITLESIDGEVFTVSRTVPDVLKEKPLEAKDRHELVVDWDKWWQNAENAKLTFYVEGHPRCNQFFTVVDLNREQRAEIQRRIREKRQNKQVKGEKGKQSPQATPAREADMPTLVRQGRIQELTRRLKESKADVNEKDSSGVTLLGIAAKNGNIEAMKVLIESGAEVDATDRVKRTPLMHGGTSKNPQVLVLLLESGADVNARDLVIGGPLAWSSAFGNAECVEILVDAGAELETKGAATGYTPLIWSAGIGDEQSLPILLSAGANIEARDTVDGGTPVMHAAQTGKYAGLKILVEAGANLDAMDRNGKTPLLRAAEHNGGTVEKIEFLLKNGAKIDVVTRSGKSALDLARTRSDDNAVEVIEFLEARMPAKAPAKDE